MEQDEGQANLINQVAGLRRQVRWLQCGMLIVFAMGMVAAAPITQEVIRTKGLIIVDDQGRDRILIGAPVPKVPGRRDDVTTSMVFRSQTGADRVIVGEGPSPIINGKIYPRMSPGWGVTLYSKAGDERGGLVNMDVGRSALALDRATGDAVGVMVDEGSGWAGLVVNYDGGKLGATPTAIQMGAQGSQSFLQASNFDGSAAGALIAGQAGRARFAETAGH